MVGGGGGCPCISPNKREELEYALKNNLVFPLTDVVFLEDFTETRDSASFSSDVNEILSEIVISSHAQRTVSVSSSQES